MPGVRGSNPRGPANNEPSPVQVLFSEIAAYAYWMSKEGYRTATIQHSVRTLRAVARKCNLLSPETVKDYLAKATVSETRKVKICEDLDRFYKHKAIRFDKPRYREIETLPFIPLEVEVSELISGVGRKRKKGITDEAATLDSLQKEGIAVNSDDFKQAFERVKAAYKETPAQFALPEAVTDCLTSTLTDSHIKNSKTRK